MEHITEGQAVEIHEVEELDEIKQFILKVYGLAAILAQYISNDSYQLLSVYRTLSGRGPPPLLCTRGLDRTTSQPFAVITGSSCKGPGLDHFLKHVRCRLKALMVVTQIWA